MKYCMITVSFDFPAFSRFAQDDSVLLFACNVTRDAFGIGHYRL